MHLAPLSLKSRRSWMLLLVGVSVQVLIASGVSRGGEPDEMRMTPVVRAVQKASPAVVSINGEKTVPPTADQFGLAQPPRHVNGMGTGVIIDKRGYVITNFHVVDQVHGIRVTLADETTYAGRVVASDRDVDLAVLKVNAPQDLPVMPIGTSSDLLIAEPVIAVGNAYGYEQTVTSGLISSLHRSVQVSDAQNYNDLIQTSASINPGNSGGPLLNIHGDMIGINVAVRAGAQSIAFAIPIDRVLEVATRLMSVKSLDNNWHGISGHAAAGNEKGLVIASVEAGSPAARAGLREGDMITTAASQSIARPLDLEKALLGRKPGEAVDLTVKRGSESLAVGMAIARVGTIEPSASDTHVAEQAWDVFGLKLSAIPEPDFRQLSSQTQYRGGLRITDVRPSSPAYREGIRQGDVLVGIHNWQIVSLENVAYVLKRPDLDDMNPVKFYILRGDQALYGMLKLASHTSQSDR